MPKAEKTLEQEGWFNQWALRFFYGPDPAMWSEQAHRNTHWQFWPQPDGEYVPVWKDKTRVPTLSSNGLEYPNSVAIDPQTKLPYTLNTKDDVITYYTGLYQGTYLGEPVQMGKVENGRTVMRSVSYGYSWSQDLYAQVPVPASNRVEHCGGPNIANDRHVNIYDPITGEIHELIQYDENVVDTIFTNQALGWARYKDGKLQEGHPTTATGNSITATMWDRDSRLDPHRIGFVLGDTEGADGTLESGPIAGSTFFLPTFAPSYIAMVKLGGECAAIAKAANTHGLLLIDRCGYVDSTNTVPGKKQRKPAINIQWGSWARTTNLNNLQIKVHELRMIPK